MTTEQTELRARYAAIVKDTFARARDGIERVARRGGAQ